MSVHDVSNIYRVPLLLLQQGFTSLLAQRLRLDGRHHSKVHTYVQLIDLCNFKCLKKGAVQYSDSTAVYIYIYVLYARNIIHTIVPCNVVCGLVHAVAIVLVSYHCLYMALPLCVYAYVSYMYYREMLIAGMHCHK
jgi:hypothetical protein